MEAVFWLSACLVVYVYAAYPALLALWARVAPRPVSAGTDTPPVTVVMAVRNEADHLRGRLDNLLSLDYPGDALQIIVVSDGSTDGTIDVLRRYRTVEAVCLTPGGKARALNAGVARACHDVLVFTDARQRLRRTRCGSSWRRCPTSVGGVSGELVLDCENGASHDGISEGVGGYWRYEKWLRRHESIVGSTMGATGAIYALRRHLWQPLPEHTILDDVLAPMRAVLASTRVVFQTGARVRHGGGRPDRAAAQDPHARRQLPDPLARAPAAQPVRQSRLAAVRVAQGGPAARALRAAGAAGVERRARAGIRLLHRGVRRPAGVLRAGRLRRLPRPPRPAAVEPPPRPCPRPVTDTPPDQRVETMIAINRAARVAFAFVLMNYAAVAGLVALGRRGPLWR
ncbi:MAG: glycosyltransferase [Vicinamibacterales bacterium]